MSAVSRSFEDAPLDAPTGTPPQSPVPVALQKKPRTDSGQFVQQLEAAPPPPVTPGSRGAPVRRNVTAQWAGMRNRVLIFTLLVICAQVISQILSTASSLHSLSDAAAVRGLGEPKLQSLRPPAPTLAVSGVDAPQLRFQWIHEAYLRNVFGKDYEKILQKKWQEKNRYTRRAVSLVRRVTSATAPSHTTPNFRNGFRFVECTHAVHFATIVAGPYQHTAEVVFTLLREVLDQICFTSLTLVIPDAAGDVPFGARKLATWAKFRGAKVLVVESVLDGVGPAWQPRPNDPILQPKDDATVPSLAALSPSLFLDPECMPAAETVLGAAEQLRVDAAAAQQPLEGSAINASAAPSPCMLFLDDGVRLSSAMWTGTCFRTLGNLESRFGGHLWMVDLALRQRLVLLAASGVPPPPLAAAEEPSGSDGESTCPKPGSHTSPSEMAAFAYKWAPASHVTHTRLHFKAAALLQRPAAAFDHRAPYGIPWLPAYFVVAEQQTTSSTWLISTMQAHLRGMATLPDSHKQQLLSLLDDVAILAATVKAAAAANKHDAGNEGVPPILSMAGLPLRRVPVLVLEPRHALRDVHAMLQYAATVPHVRNLTVVYHDALTGSDAVGLVLVLRMLLPTASEAAAGAASQHLVQEAFKVIKSTQVTFDGNGVPHRLPASYAGPLLADVVDACVMHSLVREKSFIDHGDEFCLVLRRPVRLGDPLDAFARFAAVYQHAVPFVLPLSQPDATANASATALQQVIASDFFVVHPKARGVLLDRSLQYSDLFFLDVALRLRSGILGYVVYDPVTGKVPSGRAPYFTFVARPFTQLEHAIVLAKWRFDVAVHGGDPSGLDSVSVVRPSETPYPDAAFLECLAAAAMAERNASPLAAQTSSTSSGSSSTVHDPAALAADAACLAVYGCAECFPDGEVVVDSFFASADFVTLVLNTSLFPPATSLVDRLDRIAVHLIAMLQRAQALRRANDTSTPIIPAWGSLIVAKDFGHWMTLMENNNDTPVVRYLVILNRADERLHRFMTTLQAKVEAAMGHSDDYTFSYDYFPENLGIANGWNQLCRWVFKGSLGVAGSRSLAVASSAAGGGGGGGNTKPLADWIVIMNNDITLRPGVLLDVARNTERFKSFVVTYNILGFASFAITHFGWIHMGQFDVNLWPAYTTDVEYLCRIKSRGLLRAGGGFHSDVVHAESVTARDPTFKQWLRRFMRREHIWRKWGLDINKAIGGPEAYPVFPYPYKAPMLRHNNTCVFERPHRHCVMTNVGQKYLRRASFGGGLSPGDNKHWECFFNTSHFVRECMKKEQMVEPFPVSQEPKFWRALRFVAPRLDDPKYVHAPAIDMAGLSRDVLLPLLRRGHAAGLDLVRRIAESASSPAPLETAAVSDGETQTQQPAAARKHQHSLDRCFIPILVVAIFRDMERLIALLKKLPCSVGAVVLRAVGPHHMHRSLLVRVYDTLVDALEAEEGLTAVRQKAAVSVAGEGVRDNDVRSFIAGSFDSALLERSIVSIGAGFTDAVDTAEVLDDVMGRPPRDAGAFRQALDAARWQTLLHGRPSVPPADVCSARIANGAQWKRWVLFLDVEHDLSSDGQLVQMARAMEKATFSAKGCNTSVVSVARANFFAVSMAALQRVPRFDALWGYQDVIPSYLHALAHDDAAHGPLVVAGLFGNVSRTSGYDRRRLEPFAQAAEEQKVRLTALDDQRRQSSSSPTTTAAPPRLPTDQPPSPAPASVNP